MTMFGSQWLANAGGAGYEIDQSIRFNQADSARLTRTPASAGNRKTFTFSCWLKRGNFSTLAGRFFTGYQDVNNQFEVYFQSTDKLVVAQRMGGTWYEKTTAAVYRDPSAWYHFVWYWDTTDGTAGDRTRAYINGERVTFASGSDPSLNADGMVNAAIQHEIAGEQAGSTYYYDGYMAEIHFIDGTALDPTSFGEYNDDGVWVPIEYTNAAGYGTNGFYITGETASDLGEDFSGNNNDFTSSGLATTDQMLDTPTNNFCTWNPLKTNSSATLSDGNLNYTASGAQRTTSTFAVNSGKWYAEFTISAATGSQTWGVVDIAQVSLSDAYIGQRSYEWGIDGLARTWNNGSNAANYTDFTAGDVIGIALDMDNGKVWFRDNDGTFLSGGDPAAGTTPDFSGLSGDICFAAQFTGGNVTINCGQSAYTNTPPTGFNALSTANLPTPSITDGSAQFQTSLWNGNSSTQTITQSGNSIFTPGLIWSKGRDNVQEHVIFDQVRGTTKYIQPDNSGAEGTQSGVTAFNSDGFDLGSWAVSNGTGQTHVGWQWKANGAGSSNTDGDITSTVSANPTSGVSVLTYSGNGSDNQTIGHGLGIGPKMIFSKRTDTTGNWTTYHDTVGINQVFYLNLTSAPTSNTEQYRAVPTSSVYTIGVGGDINASGGTYVAYVFAEIPGYSSIGSYEGNSSTDGTFVYTGFKPSFILTKNIDTADQWGIRDAARNPFNVTDKLLNPNAATAETTSTTGYIDILSNGFKPRSSDSNINTQTIIYMAFAENPFGGDGVAPATAR